MACYRGIRFDMPIISVRLSVPNTTGVNGNLYQRPDSGIPCLKSVHGMNVIRVNVIDLRIFLLRVAVQCVGVRRIRETKDYKTLLESGHPQFFFVFFFFSGIIKCLKMFTVVSSLALRRRKHALRWALHRQ